MLVEKPVNLSEVNPGDLVVLEYANNHEGPRNRCGFVEEVDNDGLLIEDFTVEPSAPYRRFNKDYIAHLAVLQVAQPQPVTSAEPARAAVQIKKRFWWLPWRK